MRFIQHASDSHFSLKSLSRFAALLALFLVLPSLAVHAQDKPDAPNSNDPRDTEETDPVSITASVSPTSIAAYTGTATLSWSSENAVECEFDGTDYSDSGSVIVGTYSSSGTKSLEIACTGIGESQYATKTVSLTVTRAPAPTISTTQSATLLEAGVDSLTVSWSAENADYCSAGGSNSYPTSGTANLGAYAVGTYSLSFTCSGDGGTSLPYTINWEALNRVTVSASVSPDSVDADDSETVTVSWTSTGAVSCSQSGTSGSIRFGPYSYSQAGSKSTTISCTNRLGTASASAS